MTSDVLIGFVLDRSGSMQSYHRATVDGFNSFIDEQKGVDGVALLSLTKFASTFEVTYVAEPLENVEPLGTPGNSYHPSGGTALYDAVGTTVKGIEAWLAKHPDFDGSVKIVISTDGQENQSHEWHIHASPDPEDDRDINNLINYKQGEGWEFVFFGAGQAAWLESRKFVALADTSVWSYSGHDSAAVFDAASVSLSSSRSTGASYASTLSKSDTLVNLAVNRGKENKKG